MTLEQEVASIMAFAQNSAGRPHSYYWNVPERFTCPAMYFPQPEITTGGDTFRSYASEYAWYINIFAKTTEEAHAIGLSVLTALKRARNYVPLLNEDGTETGKKLRLKDPGLKRVETGVVQLTIEWTSRRPYDLAEVAKMQHFKLDYDDKSEKEDLENAE